MSRPLVLAADIGTSSLKAALVADDGAVRATARRAYETNTPRSGWAEQNPHDWLVALKGAVSDLSERTEPGELAGLVVTGQMSAGLLVDADLSPLTPCLIWSDQRATAEAQRAESLFGAASLYRLTGNPASATYTAPKIRWFAHHAVDAFGRARRFLQPKDWLIGQLTGRVATDVSDASCTGLLDISRSCWADELFRLYQLDAGLAPEIIPAGSIAGRLRAEVASQIGLTPGLPIVMGGGDGPVAAAGSGALADGDAHASLGTSAWISFVSQRPVLDPESRLATYAHVVPGHVVETGPMQSAGAALEWAARLLGTQPSALAEMALRGPMPAATAPLFLPSIQGEGALWWFSGTAAR